MTPPAYISYGPSSRGTCLIIQQSGYRPGKSEHLSLRLTQLLRNSSITNQFLTREKRSLYIFVLTLRSKLLRVLSIACSFFDLNTQHLLL